LDRFLPLDKWSGFFVSVLQYFTIHLLLKFYMSAFVNFYVVLRLLFLLDDYP